MGTTNVTTKIIDAEMSVRWLIYICVKIIKLIKKFMLIPTRNAWSSKKSIFFVSTNDDLIIFVHEYHLNQCSTFKFQIP